MKSRSFRLKAISSAALILSLLLYCIASTSNATSFAKPPSAAEMSGAWFGYAEQDLEFLRLELDSNGKGYLAVSYLPDELPKLYQIVSWTLTGWRLALFVRPIQRDAEPIVIKNIKVHSRSMQFEIGNASNGWNRKVKLHHEKYAKERGQLAEKAIEDYRRSH